MERGDPRRRLAARRWWMASVFCLAALISYTDRLILGVLVDPIRAELGFSDSQISVLQGAAFAIVYAFAGLVLGHLADRTNRRRILIAGSIIWCSGTVAFGLLSDFSALFAARLVIGVGEAALAPAAVSMLADEFPVQQLGTAIGLFVMGTVIGGPGAIVIGGTLLDVFQSGWLGEPWMSSGLSAWRQVMVVVGMAGFLIPLLLLTVGEPQRKRRCEPVSMIGSMKRLASRWRPLAPLYAGMALVAVGDFAVLTWSPSVLSRQFQYEPHEIALTFLLITTAAGVLGTVSGGPLSDLAGRLKGIYGRFNLIVASAIVALAGVLLIGLPVVELSLAGMAIWVVASAIIGIGGIAAVQLIVANEDRGVGMALVSFFNILLGMGVGPTLVALTTENVYGESTAVGPAIATVVAPAVLISCSTFYFGRRFAEKTAGRIP